MDFEIVSAEQIVDRANPGDIAVFYSEHFHRFRTAIEQLKAKQVATLYMLDGILEWRNAWADEPYHTASPFTMRPVLCHKVACIGDNQQRMIDGWGNAAKTEVVGVMRFDRFGAAPVTTDGQQEASGQKSMRRPNEAPFQLLVNTAKTPGFNEQQMQTVRESLQDLKEVVEEFGDSIEVTWRLTAGLDREINVSNQLADATGEELYNTLQKVDAVITTPSTSILESWLANKPTALLDYHDCPSYVQAAWRIASRAQIKRAIEELQSPPETRLHFQRQMLAESLYRETPAVPRMAKLIQSMQAEAQKCLREGRPLEFPSAILTPPHSHRISPQGSTNIAFDHARIYPDFDAFGIDEKTELQVALAQSVRQNDLLELRIASLENELGQAHAIFEEIEKHPIAGPIVRMRQRLLNWWSSENSTDRTINQTPASANNAPVVKKGRSA